MVRKIVFFGIIVLMWNLGLILFPIDYGYLTTFKHLIYVNYDIYLVIWGFVSLFISYSFYRLFIDFDLNNNYIFVFLINYIFTQVFGIFFFVFNSLILSIVCMCIVATSSVLIYLEAKKIDRYSSIFGIIPIIFNGINLISLMVMFILN